MNERKNTNLTYMDSESYERKHTHLIYIDSESYVWMQEYGVGWGYSKNAEFFCEVPSNDDDRWIDGKPNISNVQFLTLSPFYPSKRLDVSVEMKLDPSVITNPNHPTFLGCRKYMPVNLLDFRPIPKHIARVIHTIGLCYYGKKEPYKTIDIEEDSKSEALKKGKELLNPNTTESIKYISCRANEEYDIYYNKKPKFKDDLIKRPKP